jgi:effector-binding domain-containing protein
MIDPPQITQSTAWMTAVIRLTIPQEEIGNVMGPGIGELMAAVSLQGLAPAGPLFAHYFRMDSGVFDFEIGLPVQAPIAPAGRVQPGELPARTVIRTVYRGPYEGLTAAWGEFSSWITANGHTKGPDLWECYVKGPESGPDASQWETELNVPLAG